MQPLFTSLHFQGADATEFLQGYVTADMDALRREVALPFACCNLKGRVVASGWASGERHQVRLLVTESAARALVEHLGKYLPFSKSRLTGAQGRVGFSRAGATDAVELPPTGWHATFDAAADEAHAEFASVCVASRFVAVATPVLAAFLPQMLGLTDVGAVSFSKGCYLGQEVVARAEHRGQVKQTLRRYRHTGEAPPPGADVVEGDRKIGTVVAVGGGFALAVARSDASSVQAADRALTLVA